MGSIGEHIEGVAEKRFAIRIANNDFAYSIGGKINDPWSPPGLPKRKANLHAMHHWDSETNTPQIVLVATGTIKEGDELLCNYGKEYWKTMWLHLIEDHASYATETSFRCKKTREALRTVKGWSDEQLKEKEMESLVAASASEVHPTSKK